MTMIMAILCFSFLSFLSPRKAQACGSCYALVNAMDEPVLWAALEEVFDQYINDQFIELEEFLVENLWEETLLPVMMLSAEEFTAVTLQQAMAIGMFFDAEIQLDTQRTLQEIQAKTHKDYRPSAGLCTLGSLSKGLANSDINADTYAVIFSEQSQDTQLGKGDMAGAYGYDTDQNNRVLHFKRLFCNQKDRGGALEAVCDDLTSWSNSTFDDDARARMNKDIDYFSMIDRPWTIGVDFSNQKIIDTDETPEIHNEDEEHIMAMNTNLFGHVSFVRPPARLLSNKPEEQALSLIQGHYMDLRAIVAKRSVAQNSLYAIAAMKAHAPRVPSYEDSSEKTATNARGYMANILKELGVTSNDEIEKLMGENPSYYAQMEILTKKLYQNPDFYTSLYDTPANVERKTVALQAIKLMQKFDMLKSHMRDEMSVSILLEMAVANLQREVNDQIGAVKKSSH